MIAWMLYAALVGAIVAVGGLALERLAAAMGQPRRIAWVAALTLAVAIPLTGIWRSPETAPRVVEGGTPESVAIGNAPVENFWSAIPVLSVPQDVSIEKIAMFAWGAGSLASLAVLAGVLLLIARGRRRWERRNVHGTEVYVSHRFGPALVGIARPRVVIPAWVLDLEPDARAAIIRHELEHARARDHLTLLYGALVVAAFPWSPAIWWMYRRLRAAVEMDCDRRVLASGIGVADYGDVLLRVGSLSRRWWGFAPAMGLAESQLERRLKTMSEKRGRLSVGRAAWLAAVAAGALVMACDAPAPAEVGDGSLGNRIEQLMGFTGFFSDPAPLLYVDGKRIHETGDLPEPVREWFDSGLNESDVVERVVVVMGYAAAALFEDVAKEGAGGAFRIFTGERDRPGEVKFVPLRLGPREVVRTRTVDQDRPLGKTPLIMVDGKPADADHWSGLAPEVIDYVGIVNKPAAETLFGPEAADGAVLIYTHRSRSRAR